MPYIGDQSQLFLHAIAPMHRLKIGDSGVAIPSATRHSTIVAPYRYAWADSGPVSRPGDSVWHQKDNENCWGEFIAAKTAQWRTAIPSRAMEKCILHLVPTESEEHLYYPLRTAARASNWEPDTGYSLPVPDASVGASSVEGGCGCSVDERSAAP